MTDYQRVISFERRMRDRQKDQLTRVVQFAIIFSACLYLIVENVQ